MEADGFILVPGDGVPDDEPRGAERSLLSELDCIVEDLYNDSSPNNDPSGVENGLLPEIDSIVEDLYNNLKPLNDFIHRNPELAFKEYQAHNALTKYMRSQKGWRVTSSAYGMETAWVAVYDSGKEGPVVSFNVEMGSSFPGVDQTGFSLTSSRCAA
jgi:hypothetical protein